MTTQDNDHAAWLRKQARLFAKASETEPDATKAKAQTAMAVRLKAAGDALQMALDGIDPNAMGGSVGIAKRLGRGQRVTVKLTTGETLTGLMGSLGKYDFVLNADDGRELVVAKHAVAYWITDWQPTARPVQPVEE
jgi:sRNA-binding regulator protein Hfq